MKRWISKPAGRGRSLPGHLSELEWEALAFVHTCAKVALSRGVIDSGVPECEWAVLLVEGMLEDAKPPPDA